MQAPTYHLSQQMPPTYDPSHLSSTYNQQVLKERCLAPPNEAKGQTHPAPSLPCCLAPPTEA